MILQFWKYHKLSIFMALASCLFYISFAYDLVRSDFTKLITLYGALFFLFYTLVKTEKLQPNFLNFLVLLFRLSFLFAIPNLSQDFYRFIWDGRMLLEGWNPYLHLPETLIEKNSAPIAQAQELYKGMGALSAQHYTNYPPVNQLLFLIAAIFSGNHILGAVIILRILIITADLGVLHFGQKLLTKLDLPIHYIYLYALNPFIIIELTGNLHFEGVMLFFLVLALWLIANNQWKTAALSMALSIAVKLIPLMFLPIFFQKLRFKKAVGFYIFTILIILVLFAPFISWEFARSYSDTIALWFINFEFNGSIYTVFKEIGYKINGYNSIKTIGKITPILVILVIIIISLFRKNSTVKQLISGMLLVLSFYLFTASVVHPWYISTLLLLSVFTRYRFPILWSLTIMLSYYTYSLPDFKENYLILSMQYLPVIVVCIHEIFISNKKLSF